MKERRKQREPQTSSTQSVVSLSLFVSNGEVSDEKVQIIVELVPDELEQPQLTGILASFATDSDCACE